jgi:hypothetical protein
MAADRDDEERRQVKLARKPRAHERPEEADEKRDTESTPRATCKSACNGAADTGDDEINNELNECHGCGLQYVARSKDGAALRAARYLPA